MASPKTTERFLSIGAPSAVAYRGSAVDLKAVESDWTWMNALFSKELKFVQDGGTVWDPQLTKASLVARLREFFASPAPLHVLIYLGHGHYHNGDWLLQASGQLPEVVGLEDVWGVWNSTHAARGVTGHLLIYVDSCFAGFWAERATLYGLTCSIQCATDRSVTRDGFFTERWLQFARGQIDEAALLQLCDKWCAPRAYSEGKHMRLLNGTVARVKSVFHLIDSKAKGAAANAAIVVAPKPPVNDGKVVVAPFEPSNIILKNLRQRLDAAVHLVEKNAELQSALSNRHDTDLKTLLGQRASLTQLPHRRRVAVVGQTGVGKTTLINNLLGVPLLRSIDGESESITWCPTSLSTDLDAPVGKCRITRVYYTEEEWHRRRGVLLEVNGRRKGNDGNEVEPDAKELDEMRKKRLNSKVLRALYTVENTNKLLHLKSGEHFETDDVRRRLGQLVPSDWMSFNDAERHLKDLTDLAKETDDKKFVFNDWPLVKEVHVVGAFPSLPPYVTVIDTPGTNDRDNKRNQICDFKSFIARSTRVWYVGANDRLPASMEHDIKELESCGVLDRVAVIRTNCESLGLQKFNKWTTNMQNSLKKSVGERKIEFFRVANDLWKAYRIMEDPLADKKWATGTIAGGAVNDYPDANSTGIPILRAELEMDSKDAIKMMYDASFELSNTIQQIFAFVSDAVVHAGVQPIDKKSADAAIKSGLEGMAAVQKAFEDQLVKGVSLPAASDGKFQSIASGKPAFTVDLKVKEQTLKNLLDTAAYNTLQAFFRRRGDWKPPVVDWMRRAFLVSSKVEQHWVNLFDAVVPAVAHTFCGSVRETAVKSLDHLPATAAGLQRVTLARAAAVEAEQAERRLLQIAFDARQELQRGIGRYILDFLVKHPTFFRGEDSGSGCRQRMQKYILKELQNMGPLYDHVVKSIIADLDATLVAPLSREAKLVVANLMNHFALALTSHDAKKKPLSAALLEEFAKLGCKPSK